MMSPDQIKKTFLIRVWAFFNVPMLAWVRPRVIQMDSEKVEIAIPLNRRTKNHLKSMYFGTLAAGADMAAGVALVNEISKSKSKFSFAFKAVKGEFLKRAECTTHFVCQSPSEVANLMKKAEQSGQREELPVKVTAFTPKKLGDTPVAEFELLLSVKKK